MRHTVQHVLLLLTFLLCAEAAVASGTAETEVKSVYTDRVSSGAAKALALREEPVSYTKVIKTSYFDIIFPPQSERTALILASRVDELYEKAAFEFETEPWMRHFPIIISPTTQVFNAYYTASPYNHIVLLDTPNTSASLAVESETIVNTFYHELVHAVTANIHKNSRKNRNNLFGDFYSLQFLLNSKLFFIEGATVSRESSEGEGRVNSGEAMSMIIQSKIEGTFPAWRDISGPRDIYPSQNASYMFGGAFNAWLQNEYGMSTYADFWKECSTVHISGVTGIFKKVYGMSLDDAWELFEQSVPIPVTEAESKRIVLDDGSRFASLAIRPGNEKGIVYTKNSCSVMYRSLNDHSSTGGQELFSCYGAPNQLSFSSDGRYLAVSSYMTGSAEAYGIRIYDMKKGCFTGAEIPYSRNAVITEGASGEKYLFCVESAASYQFVSMYRLNDILNAVEDRPAPVSRTELSVFDELYDTAPVPGGAACLRKAEGIWYLTMVFTDGSGKSWRFPDYAVPSGLSIDCESNFDGSGSDGKIRLCTSITSKSMNAGSESEPGALARLGVIEINGLSASLSFQKTAFSGGVHGPAISSSGFVYNIANFYESSELCFFDIKTSEMTVPYILECCNPVLENGNTNKVAFKTETYRPASYMKRGVLFPIAGLNLSPFSSNTISNPVGVTWWTETPEEKVNLELSLGIPVSAELPMQINAAFFGQQKTVSGRNFLWDINGDILFDEKNRMNQVSAQVILAENVPLSHPGNTVTILNALTMIDRSFYPETKIRYAIGDTISAKYEHLKKKGMNPLAVEGVRFSFHLFYEYDVLSTYNSDIKSRRFKYNEKTMASPGVSAGFQLARLLPLPYMPNLTVNWPVTVSASLWNDPATFVTADASVTLFSAEIQKGLPLVPFYCNRFTVNAGWSFRNGAPSGYQFASSWLLFETDKFIKQFSTLTTENAFTAGINFELSPDIGNMYSYHFNAGLNGKYYLRNDNSDKQYELSLFGVIKF